MNADSARKNGDKHGGKPAAIDDETLFSRRDGFIDLLVYAWGDVGWELRHAHTPGRLVAVFTSLAPPAYLQHLLTPFVRTTEGRATAADVRKTRNALQNANAEAYDLTQRIRPLAESVHESAALLSQLSAEHADAIRAEHQRRLLEHEPLRRQLDTLEHERTALQSVLTDQEASYAQDELLRFLETRKYAHNPRNLAYAMAGLPYIGWWQSFRRCEGQSSAYWPSHRYQIFEMIAKCCRPDASKQAILDCLRRAVLAIDLHDRSRDRRDHTRMALRDELSTNWRYLRQAVEETDIAEVDSACVPYRVFSAYLKNIARPQTVEERILASSEQLDR